MLQVCFIVIAFLSVVMTDRQKTDSIHDNFSSRNIARTSVLKSGLERSIQWVTT